FFKHGNCTAGSECSFSHDINLFVEKAVCKYYVKGNCKYGNRCALLHTASGDASIANGQPRPRPSASSDDSSRSESGSSENAQNDGGDKQQTPKSSDAAVTASRSSTSVNSASTARRTSPPSTLGSGPASRQPISSKDRPLTSGDQPSGTNQQNRPNGSGASSDSDSATKKQINAWATGSLSNGALRKDQAPKRPTLDISALLGTSQASQQQQRTVRADDDLFDNSLFSSQAKDSAVSPFRAHFESVQNSATVDSKSYPRSQPIPKPSTGFSRPGKGGISVLAQGGGLSLQDSLRIDNLAMSHGAARQSFGGPSFTSGSIPMLDNFGEHSRSDAGFSPGNTPLAHSFARSPPAISSSMMLGGRHAFTAVDSSSSVLGTPDAEFGSGSLRGMYHNHLQSQVNPAPIRSSGDGARSSHYDMSPALYPIGSARSIPRSNDLFGRPLRSSSFMNEPASPRNSFAYAPDLSEGGILGAHHGSPLGNTSGELSGATGRLRSNSHIPSPSLMGLSMGMDFRGTSKPDSGIATHASFQDSPFLLKESRLGGYPLPDTIPMSYDRAQQAPR
ncbi:hypothetical protein GGF38_001844, partial [Coemansia sp. RSA 25]